MHHFIMLSSAVSLKSCLYLALTLWTFEIGQEMLSTTTVIETSICIKVGISLQILISKLMIHFLEHQP